MTTLRWLRLVVTAVVSAASITSCGFMYTTSGSKSCDPHASLRHPVGNADYLDFIQWKGRLYVATSNEETRATFGEQLGKVRCQFDGSRTPTGSRPRDRDAAFLEPGTPFFMVEGVSETVGIGATSHGRRLLYLAEPPQP